MQVYDYSDRVMEKKIDNLEKLEEQKKELEKREDVKKVIIGPLPKTGDRFWLNNLLFQVNSVLSRGRLIVKVVGKK